MAVTASKQASKQAPKLVYGECETALGRVYAIIDAAADSAPLWRLGFVDGRDDAALQRSFGAELAAATAAVVARSDAAVAPVFAQLEAYLRGARQHFTIALTPRGTPFQNAVWRALGEIPYGETISYAQLAARVGRPRAARAVGAANARNPIPIVVPCHRVIAADGSLGGFSAGIDRKRALLRLEGASVRDASATASR